MSAAGLSTAWNPVQYGFSGKGKVPANSFSELLREAAPPGMFVGQRSPAAKQTSSTLPRSMSSLSSGLLRQSLDVVSPPSEKRLLSTPTKDKSSKIFKFFRGSPSKVATSPQKSSYTNIPKLDFGGECEPTFSPIKIKNKQQG